MCFFALRMTTGLKIPGVVIPRRVFTQPRPVAEVAVNEWHFRLACLLLLGDGGITLIILHRKLNYRRILVLWSRYLQI